jgi:hypothetical protein
MFQRSVERRRGEIESKFFRSFYLIFFRRGEIGTELVTPVFFSKGVESGRGDIDTQFSYINFCIFYSNSFAKENPMFAR